MDLSRWLVFVVSVTGQNGSLRVRLWRQLKAIGAATLRDGVYLMPDRPEQEQLLANLHGELLAADAQVQLLHVIEVEPDTQTEFQRLFSRDAEYAEWQAALASFLSMLPGNEPDARRTLRHLRKQLENIAAIDFFPGATRDRVRIECNEAERQITRHYSPDEPLTSNGEIRRLAAENYRQKRWATRARPWVDRVASAWLIRRFIDKDAHIMWLTDIRTCPDDALGFDFDGATFTHVADQVTFEVLLACFGLEQDQGLMRLGKMVHTLDIGGPPVPEACGFEAMLGGARTRIQDDDQLLDEISRVLDSLYTHFSAETTV